ncbi:MAG: endonuclease/exonuclease/phosphatase family protein [Myxococcales bacterium]|nr:endonuclease/exonuclease/phosphatase family protein [Myxococcales bacterium]
MRQGLLAVSVTAFVVATGCESAAVNGADEGDALWGERDTVEATSDTRQLNWATWNIQFRRLDDWPALLEWFVDSEMDVMALQEVSQVPGDTPHGRFNSLSQHSEVGSRQYLGERSMTVAQSPFGARRWSEGVRWQREAVITERKIAWLESDVWIYKLQINRAANTNENTKNLAFLTKERASRLTMFPPVYAQSTRASEPRLDELLEIDTSRMTDNQRNYGFWTERLRPGDFDFDEQGSFYYNVDNRRKYFLRGRYQTLADRPYFGIRLRENSESPDPTFVTIHSISGREDRVDDERPVPNDVGPLIHYLDGQFESSRSGHGRTTVDPLTPGDVVQWRRTGESWAPAIVEYGQALVVVGDMNANLRVNGRSLSDYHIGRKVGSVNVGQYAEDFHLPLYAETLPEGVFVLNPGSQVTHTSTTTGRTSQLDYAFVRDFGEYHVDWAESRSWPQARNAMNPWGAVIQVEALHNSVEEAIGGSSARSDHHIVTFTVSADLDVDMLSTDTWRELYEWDPAEHF